MGGIIETLLEDSREMMIKNIKIVYWGEIMMNGLSCSIQIHRSFEFFMYFKQTKHERRLFHQDSVVMFNSVCDNILSINPIKKTSFSFADCNTYGFDEKWSSIIENEHLSVANGR